MGNRFSMAVLAALCLFGCFSLSVTAQHKTIHFCQQGHATEKLLELHPKMKDAIHATDEQLENFTQNFIQQRAKRRSTYVIPVVFHIIHLNGPENISDAQIFDVMRILNEDFNKENDDLAEVTPAFQSIIGDADIEFRLAQLDPNGNPTTGIDRIFSNETNVGDDGSKLNPWPRSMYLNVWVTNQINGAAGAAAYAYLPTGVQSFPLIDGIIANHRYIGSIGTSDEDAKHTLSHEVGHVLNLRHPWGPTNDPEIPSNCNTDDGVSDTPNTIGTLGSCNLSQVTCGSLDNVQNIMDYASCDRMFTEGQVDRMHATLNSFVSQRNNLWLQSNLEATGVAQLTVANFGAINPTICIGESVEFYDLSTYDPTGLNWSFEGGDINSSSSSTPVVTYNQPGSYEVSLEASQNSTSVTESKSGFVMVRPVIGQTTPLIDGFEQYSDVPNSNWYAFENQDFPSYGWEYETGAGYQSSRSLKMNNYQAPSDQEFILESNGYDLSVYSDAKLTFRYAYATRDGNPGLDKVSIFYSTDCGDTWVNAFSKFGGQLGSPNLISLSSPYTPTSDSDWKSDSISLSAAAMTDATIFRFVFESAGGNNFYLDDINIRGTFQNQAQLRAPLDLAVEVGLDSAISWQPMTCDSYEIQYDQDGSFQNATSVVQNFIDLVPGSDNSYTTLFDPNQEYFWRVRLIRNGVEEPWSDVWSFTTGNFINGISDVNAQNVFNLYPNPANEQITITLSEEFTNGELEVYNLFGQLIHNDILTENNNVLLNTSPWSAGMYIVRISSSEFVQSEQVVISH